MVILSAAFLLGAGMGQARADIFANMHAGTRAETPAVSYGEMQAGAIAHPDPNPDLHPFPDSMSQPPKQWNLGPAGFAAGLTLPALAWAYTADSHEGVFCASVIPAMIGYGIAWRTGLAFPLARSLAVAGGTFLAYYNYELDHEFRDDRTEAQKVEDDRQVARINRIGYYVMGFSTVIDFFLIAYPHGNVDRLSVGLTPDSVTLAYRL